MPIKEYVKPSFTNLSAIFFSFAAFPFWIAVDDASTLARA